MFPGAGSVQQATPTPTPPLDGLLPPGLVAFLRSEPGRLLLALAVVVAGWYLSKFAVRLLGRPVARRFGRPSITRTVLRSVRVVGVVLTLLAALSLYGLGIGNVVLSVTVFSAVVGIVLAPIVGSVINGLFVLADQPYEVGDLVELADGADGTRGFVEDITLRYTKVFTLDNTFLVVPNSAMRERDVVNYSAEDERTRLSLELLVTYDSDLDRARQLAERAARDVDDVIGGGPAIRIGSARYPAAPTCYVDEYADSGVLLTLRYWAKEPYKLLTVRSAVNERVWGALGDEPAVEIAYPHQQLVFDEDGAAANVRVQGAGTDDTGENRPGDAGPPDDGG